MKKRFGLQPLATSVCQPFQARREERVCQQERPALARRWSSDTRRSARKKKVTPCIGWVKKNRVSVGKISRETDDFLGYFLT